MSSLPLDGDPRAMMMAMHGQPAAGGQPYASTTLLRQTNTVKTVATDAQVIDPDIQVLLVAEAQNLSDATLYAIDQFVMRGGRLMVMVDPWSEAMAATPSPTGMPPSDTSSESEETVRRLGHRVRSHQGGRRSHRGVARARQCK